MRFDVEFDREDDSRWIAEIVNLPGAMAYGDTPEWNSPPWKRSHRGLSPSPF